MSGCSVTHTLRAEEKLVFPEESEEEEVRVEDEDEKETDYESDERDKDEENEGEDGDEEAGDGDNEKKIEDKEEEEKEEDSKPLVDDKGREWIRVEGMKDVVILKPPVAAGGGKGEGEGKDEGGERDDGGGPWRTRAGRSTSMRWIGVEETMANLNGLWMKRRRRRWNGGERKEAMDGEVEGQDGEVEGTNGEVVDGKAQGRLQKAQR